MNAIEAALTRSLLGNADLATLLETIYRRRYTGMIVLHCHNGVPKVAAFPSIQLTLQSGGLDTPPSASDPS
jgi:hypothetical protein